jgi:hypothetical protein
MGYETYNWFIVDISAILKDQDITLSAANPISVSIPVRTNLCSSEVNTFTKFSGKQQILGFDSLLLKTISVMSEQTALSYYSSG